MGGDTESAPSSSPRRAHIWAFAAAFVFVFVVIGIVALVFRGGESPVADQAPAAPTTELQSVVEPIDQAATLPTGGTPLPDFAGAIPGDDGAGPMPLGTVHELPGNVRLDFLFEFCGPECYRDAHFTDPSNPLVGSGVWTAGRPFHVRHGFINNDEEQLGDGFDVALYVFSMELGEPSPLAQTVRYTALCVAR